MRENALRAEILDICRGYSSRTLNFADFPVRTKWFRAEFNADNFESLQYIEDSQNWNRLSKGTRHVRDGCSYIYAMPERSNPARFVRSIFSSIEKGEKLPPIIVVTNPKHSKLVILEGACRSTAYYRAFEERLIKKVRAVVGGVQKYRSVEIILKDYVVYITFLLTVILASRPKRVAKTLCLWITQ